MAYSFEYKSTDNSTKVETQNVTRKPNNIDLKVDLLNNKKDSLPKDIQDKIEELNKLDKSSRIFYYKKTSKILLEIDQAFKTKIEAALDGETTSKTKSKIEKNHGTDLSDKWGNSSEKLNENESKSFGDNSNDKLSENDFNGSNSEKKYQLFLNYLDFKGYDKNSVFYKSIKTNLLFLKKSPFLMTNEYKSIEIGVKKYTYKEFLETFIDDNIKKFINGEDISFNLDNNKDLYKDIYKEKESLKTELIKDKKLDETWLSINVFSPIDDARDKIRDLQELSFDDLYKNIDTYLEIDYIDTNLISTRMDTFIVSSVGDGDEEGTFAKYLNDNQKNISDNLNKKLEVRVKKEKEEIKKTLKQSEILFKEYREALLEVKSILDSYNGDIPEDIKRAGEKEMKGLVSGMMFINGLHGINYEDLISGLYSIGKNSTLPGTFDYIIPYYGPIIIVGLTSIGFLTRYILKKRDASKFIRSLDGLKIQEKDGDDKGEKIKDKFKEILNKKLENININELESLIKELSEEGKGEEIKDGYEKIEKTFNRLKLFTDIKIIVRDNKEFKGVNGKLDINSIFLNDSDFSRDIIEKFATNNNKWYKLGLVNGGLKISKMYFGLGSIGETASIFGIRPLVMGGGNKYFNGIKAIPALADFVKEYKGKTDIDNFDKKTKDIKNLKIKKLLIDKLLIGKDVSDIERSIDTIKEIYKLNPDVDLFGKTIDSLIFDSLSKNNNLNIDKRVSELLGDSSEKGELKMISDILEKRQALGLDVKEISKMDKILRSGLLEAGKNNNHIKTIYEIITRENVKYKKGIKTADIKKEKINELKSILNNKFNFDKFNSVYESYNNSESFRKENYKGVETENNSENKSSNKEKISIENNIFRSKIRALKLIDKAILQIGDSVILSYSQKEELKTQLNNMKTQLNNMNSNNFKNNYEVEFSRSLRKFKSKLGEIPNVDVRNVFDIFIDKIDSISSKLYNYTKDLFNFKKSKVKVHKEYVDVEVEETESKNKGDVIERKTEHKKSFKENTQAKETVSEVKDTLDIETKRKYMKSINILNELFPNDVKFDPIQVISIDSLKELKDKFKLDTEGLDLIDLEGNEKIKLLWEVSGLNIEVLNEIFTKGKVDSIISRRVRSESNKSIFEKIKAELLKGLKEGKFIK